MLHALYIIAAGLSPAFLKIFWTCKRCAENTTKKPVANDAGQAMQYTVQRSNGPITGPPATADDLGYEPIFDKPNKTNNYLKYKISQKKDEKLSQKS